MYFQQDFSTTEFALRRQKIAAAIGPSAKAVLAGATDTGAFDYFRQTNDFYYLTGVEVPHAYLSIDGATAEATLYLPPHDPKHERSEGAQMHADAPDAVRAITGIEHIAHLGQLAENVRNSSEIWLPSAPAELRQTCRDTLRHQAKLRDADPWDQRPTREQWFLSKLQAAAPQASIHDLTPTLDKLRLYKSQAELALMRRAGSLSARSVYEAMRSTRPGMLEYQLTAIADHVYVDGGARTGSYRAIIASGKKNIWNAHYYRCDSRLQAGEMVLMDYAPDLGCYTSDIGRMWPVDGRYSALDRELYGFVVAYQQVLIDILRPGRTVEELVAESAERMQPTWESWSFSKPSYRAAAQKMIQSPVAFTHPVGMAVHDVGTYRGEPLQEGLVFALDPQLWVPDEELYIRVEDTVAITSTGVEVHTAGVPMDLDKVERILTPR